jgi:hypothetical protein
MSVTGSMDCPVGVLFDLFANSNPRSPLRKIPPLIPPLINDILLRAKLGRSQIEVFTLEKQGFEKLGESVLQGGKVYGTEGVRSARLFLCAGHVNLSPNPQP